MSNGLSKRGFVVVIAAAVVAVSIGVLSRVRGPDWWRSSGDPNALRGAPAGPAVRAYFGDLTEGKKLDRWTLVHIYEPRKGAIPVVLATDDGKRFQIDLLKRDPAGPRGVAETTQLSLFISNSGDGKVPTPEEQAQGAVQLAAALTTRENAGAKPPELSTMSERMSQPERHHFAVPLEP
jgi:hypothetical protein